MELRTHFAEWGFRCMNSSGSPSLWFSWMTISLEFFCHSCPQNILGFLMSLKLQKSYPTQSIRRIPPHQSESLQHMCSFPTNSSPQSQKVHHYSKDSFVAKLCKVCGLWSIRSMRLVQSKSLHRQTWFCHQGSQIFGLPQMNHTKIFLNLSWILIIWLDCGIVTLIIIA